MAQFGCRVARWGVRGARESGSAGVSRVLGRNSSGLSVGRRNGRETVARLSATRGNGPGSRVTSAMPGSVVVIHRCPERSEGLTSGCWCVSAFWSRTRADAKLTCRLAAGDATTR